MRKLLRWGWRAIKRRVGDVECPAPDGEGGIADGVDAQPNLLWVNNFQNCSGFGIVPDKTLQYVVSHRNNRSTFPEGGDLSSDVDWIADEDNHICQALYLRAHNLLNFQLVSEPVVIVNPRVQLTLFISRAALLDLNSVSIECGQQVEYFVCDCANCEVGWMKCFNRSSLSDVGKAC